MKQKMNRGLIRVIVTLIIFGILISSVTFIIKIFGDLFSSLRPQVRLTVRDLNDESPHVSSNQKRVFKAMIGSSQVTSDTLDWLDQLIEEVEASGQYPSAVLRTTRLVMLHETELFEQALATDSQNIYNALKHPWYPKNIRNKIIKILNRMGISFGGE